MGTLQQMLQPTTFDLTELSEINKIKFKSIDTECIEKDHVQNTITYNPIRPVFPKLWAVTPHGANKRNKGATES